MYVHLPRTYDWVPLKTPFRAALIYEWNGSTFGRTSVPSPCPLTSSLPHRSHPGPRSIPSWAKQELCPSLPFNPWQQRPFKRLLKLTYRWLHFMYSVWKINIYDQGYCTCIHVLSFLITTRVKFGKINDCVIDTTRLVKVLLAHVTYEGVTCTFEFRPLSMVDESGRVAVKNVGRGFNKQAHFYPKTRKTK